MNSTGKIEPDNETKMDGASDDSPSGKRSPILLILLGGILIVCLVIGVQAFGILYSIVFPPSPPLQDAVTEVRQTNIDHGVDEWCYETEQDACEVMRYYQSKNGQCSLAENACSENTEESVTFGTVGQHVATCIGAVEFNIFAYRWEANIADGYQGGITQFNLLREVFWTGAVPPRLDPRKGFDFGG